MIISLGQRKLSERDALIQVVNSSCTYVGRFGTRWGSNPACCCVRWSFCTVVIFGFLFVQLFCLCLGLCRRGNGTQVHCRRGRGGGTRVTSCTDTGVCLRLLCLDGAGMSVDDTARTSS